MIFQKIHIGYDIFKIIFLNEFLWLSLKFRLNFILKHFIKIRWDNRDKWDSRINARFRCPNAKKINWDTWDKSYHKNFFSIIQSHLISIRSQARKALDTLLNYTQYFS